MDNLPMHLTSALLKELAMRANNVIMKGSFRGDDNHEASEVMRLCLDIYKATEKKDGKKKS